MRVALSFSLLLLTSLAAIAQQPTFHVARIAPYDQAASGEIMELEVEGLGRTGAPVMLQVEDFKLVVSQDGVSQEAKIRNVLPTMKSAPLATDDRANAGPGGLKMRAFQSVYFVVPKGLHPGDAELTLSYKGQPTDAIRLQVVEVPPRPTAGSLAVMVVHSSSLPTNRKIEGNDLGWRLERGSSAQFLVHPITDPDDPNSAVLIRFKQGEKLFEVTGRVTNQPRKVRSSPLGMGFFPARDVLEVDVPTGLVVGPVEVEIRLRANGHESEAAKLHATITDASQSTEAPSLNAPRLLLVAPTRVGAGQSMLLSLDYRRTLDPDPIKTLVVVEQGTARYLITPENNSANFDRNKAPDAPVMLFARTTKEIIGNAQVRVFNELRGQQTGMSDPVPIEIVADPIPAELVGVNVSSQGELAHLQQMYDLATQAGHKFPDYDPASDYLTIRVRKIDLNPRYVRITLTQNEKQFVLGPQNFSSFSNDTLIVRLPAGLKNGEATITIENRGVDAFSEPAAKTFELCCIR